MSETLESLRRKIEGAGELASVVRTMKAVAASNITQYEKAVEALDGYDRTVQMGLRAALRHVSLMAFDKRSHQERGSLPVFSVAFGSDQGFVGQFNDALAALVASTLADRPEHKLIWAVGQRMQDHLASAGLTCEGVFSVPSSVSAVTSLVGDILSEYESKVHHGQDHALYLFHNHIKNGAFYVPDCRQVLPLDGLWLKSITESPWPTRNLPEVVGPNDDMLKALIREYLFVSLFQSCAESLASENASRLAAMQRAEKNIDELLSGLGLSFHQLRQSSIDEELSDIISGFEALKHT